MELITQTIRDNRQEHLGYAGEKVELVMDRRKVFILLWAFGLMMGINGATVLAAEQGVEETTEKENAVEETYVSRVVTFTDCTGMQVTYDANASREYIYEVEDGVLKGVKVKKTDETGAWVSEAVKFEGNVELKQPEEGEKYTSVAADLLSGNRSVTYVKLPAGVTTITAESFRGCTALKSVYLPATVATIEREAFRECTSMTQLAVPKSVVTIGESAFQGDTKLQMLYFRDGDSGALTVIGANAFPGADEAKELVIIAKKGSKAESYAKENGLSFEENEPEE